MSNWRRENDGDNEVALRRYVEILLHWWWLFLIVPVAMLPMLLSKGSPEPVVRYETDTRILIQSVGSGLSDLLANQRLPQLYVELVTERDMLVEVREELGLSESVETIQEWISAMVVSGTSILELEVTHTDPVVAAAVANKLAEVFILRTQERRLTEVGRLQAMAGAMGVVENGQILSQQLSALGSFTIVRPAAVPSAPVPVSSGGRSYTQMVLAVLGAAMLAFALEYMAGKVRSPEKLEGALGYEPLGVVPGWRRRGEDECEIVTLKRPTTVHAEAYRQMVAMLEPFWAEEGHAAKAPVVTSAAPVEGKTTTAVNLAVSAAESGRKVILVDGDLWRPDVHRWFGLSNDVELTNMLAEPSMPLESVLQTTELENLHVVTSGPRPLAQSQLLEKGVAEEVLARLKEEAEIVIIDSPPMLARSDAFRLASIADGVIVVADANRTRTSALRRTLQYVEQARAHAGSRFLGVVLNRFQPPRIAQYVYYRYYGGYYGYHEQYGSEPERVQEKTPVLPLPGKDTR